MAVGSRAQVFNGTKDRTSGGLRRKIYSEEKMDVLSQREQVN